MDDISGDQALIQRDINSTNNWAHKSLMDFEKRKCKVLHLEGIFLIISACWDHATKKQFSIEVGDPGGQQVRLKSAMCP